MPFVSEEIWQQMPRPSGTPTSIMITTFARADQRYLDDDAERAMDVLQQVVVAVRGVRADYNVAPGATVDVIVHAREDFARTILSGYKSFITDLARRGEKK
jgi:valyl-tRNA synthetase